MTYKDSTGPTRRRSHGRHIAFTSLLVPSMLAMAACSQGGTTTTGQTGRPGTSVTIVTSEEPTSLDACDSTNSGRSRILRQNVTESLTLRDPKTTEPQPLLATKWSSSQDNKTWTFELRQGVTFQDGEAFNAQAVATSMNRLFDEKLACDDAGDFFGPPKVLSTTATGDYEVTLSLDQPDPIFPLRMTYIQIGAPDSSMANKSAPAIGTGPYKITEWSHGEFIQLDRYDGYWGEKPKIASAKYVWRAESSVRESMIETGEADLAVAVSPQDVPKGTNVTSQTFENGETTYFRIDAEVAPLNDIRLREALNLATDRKGIIASAFGGYGNPAHELFVSTTLGYNKSLTDWDYDPNKAAQLVKDAAASGVDVGKEIVLYGRPDFYPGAREVTEILASAWKAIGLNIRIENVEGGPWGELLLRPHADGREPNVLQSSHGNATGDASFTVVSKYTCQGSQSASCDPEFDSLVNQALTAPDLDSRGKLFEQAMARERSAVVQDIPLAYMKEIFLLSARLQYTTTIQSDFELRIADMSLA